MAPFCCRRCTLDIIDIRRHEIRNFILTDMNEMLRPPPGMEKEMPTMLLYDEAGLKLFEQITYLDEYYLTNAEIEVLERHADAIAERIPLDALVVELGSGNLRKINILLQALDRANKNIDYYALDLSLSELQRTLATVPPGAFKHVRCHGLLGTYDDGLAWLKVAENVSRPKCILSMGSSIGNFTRADAARFLRGFADELRDQDLVLVGLDGCQDKEKISVAYNDPYGITHNFVRNGLVHANRILGKEAFRLDEWEVIGEYDVATCRHQAFYVPLKDISVNNVHFKAGERVRVEESNKYSAAQSEQLWEAAGLTVKAVFGDRTGHYNIHMLSAAVESAPLDPRQYASKPIPSLVEFEALWKSWDMVTKTMIPEEELLSKPIKLRNSCIFYLGHIPAFLDIHLTRATAGVLTEPREYSRIFERGIDPDVDNPGNCHDHSEIPETWPPVQDILAFQERVRRRTRKLYVDGFAMQDRRLGQALWLGFEHEAMHLETFLYMLLQSEKTIPPPGPLPDFKALSEAAHPPTENAWIKVPTRKVRVGLVEEENQLRAKGYFGWDNEKPSRTFIVPAFEAKARPITNKEYSQYLVESEQAKIPASWISISSKSTHVSENNAPLDYVNRDGHLINGRTKGRRLTDAFLDGKAVRTLYGPVPLIYAFDWPVIASYDELAGCAKWMDGRIPTMEEVRSIYAFVEELQIKDAGAVSAENIPAVNGQHVSDTSQDPNPYDLFANLEGCNVGFKNFHPVPVTQTGHRLAGQSNFGGAWEWTSSVLEKHEGFKPMDLYPEYTADFFDGKHNIMLGGSWATHPRIAGRKTFVNWYQRNYPYMWAGARLVRDIQ